MAMMIVAIASVWFCRRWTAAPWKWFWVGAGIWTLAVAVKFAIAIPLNGPLLGGLKSSLPHWAYLTLGMIYGGGLTGITEVLFTYLAALRWRQMSATADRAVAVGVGVGAFEAALLAIAATAGTIVAGLGVPTWSVALAPAMERVIAILCHTASRVLVLLAVARAMAFVLLRISVVERRRRGRDVPVSVRPGEQSIAVDHGGDVRSLRPGQHSNRVSTTTALGQRKTRRSRGHALARRIAPAVRHRPGQRLAVAPPHVCRRVST